MEYKSKKSQILGMHHGTAHNRMEKNVTFYLAQQLGKDTCYRCGQKITDIEDFTYDHIIDWQDKPNAKELFLNPENIAFSHLGCNSRHTSNLMKVNNKSGFKGVYCNEKRVGAKKWQAQIYNLGKRATVGNYATAKEAAEAYDKKAIEWFGDEAITNKKLGLL